MNQSTVVASTLVDSGHVTQHIAPVCCAYPTGATGRLVRLFLAESLNQFVRYVLDQIFDSAVEEPAKTIQIVRDRVTSSVIEDF